MTQKDNKLPENLHYIPQKAFYSVIPYHVISCPNVSPAAKYFFALLSNLTNQYGFCFASNEYLEEMLMGSPWQVRSFLNELKEAGLIFIVPRDQKNRIPRKIYVSKTAEESIHFKDGDISLSHEDLHTLLFHNKIVSVVKSHKSSCGIPQEGTPSSIYINTQRENSKVPHNSLFENQCSKSPAGKQENTVAKRSSSTSLEASRLANLLLKNIRALNPKAKDSSKTWAKDIDKLIRIDKRTPEEVEAMIAFVHKDPFWSTNILSGAKLRKHFERLELKQTAEKEYAKKTNVLDSYAIEEMKSYVYKASDVCKGFGGVTNSGFLHANKLYLFKDYTQETLRELVDSLKGSEDTQGVHTHQNR